MCAARRCCYFRMEVEDRRGLLKTQFEEIETDGCAERIKKRVERPPIIGEKDLPGFQVRNRTFDGSADGTDLVIVLMLTHVEFTTLWLLCRLT